MNKNQFSEDDISVKYITSALVKAGWDEAKHVRRQVSFTKDRIIVRKPKTTDSVLNYRRIPVAVIEAEESSFSPSPPGSAGPIVVAGCGMRSMQL